MTPYIISEVVGKAATELHEREGWKNRFKSDFQQGFFIFQPEIDFGLVEGLFADPEFNKQLRIEVKQVVTETLEPKPTRGSLVYKKLQKKLDLNQYQNQFVAIDVEKKELVATGQTLEEAAANARAKTKSTKLYFKHVGHDYLFRV